MSKENAFKLTIITVNLNNKSGLQKTLSSIVSQTVAFYELIIIDGASTDGSLEVILENKNSISYWVSEPDNGIYHAMNKGIIASKGEYLLFLNSGDYLVTNEVLGNVFYKAHSEDILYGRSYISKNGKRIYTTPHPEKLTLNFFFTQTISHQAAFIKRSLFEKYGYYRENYKVYSDLEFWIRTIVLNNCTTTRIDLIISDYNLEGISNSQKGIEVSELENREIFKNAIPPRILEDYDNGLHEGKQMEVLLWIKTKSWLYKTNEVLFWCASKLFFLRKKLRSPYKSFC